MTLANLLAIQRLLAFSATPHCVQRLLAAATRNLADAQLKQLSAENRFDAAYKCLMQCAMLGMWARGYRTSTSQPGHHQTGPGLRYGGVLDFSVEAHSQIQHQQERANYG